MIEFPTDDLRESVDHARSFFLRFLGGPFFWWLFISQERESLGCHGAAGDLGGGVVGLDGGTDDMSTLFANNRSCFLYRSIQLPCGPCLSKHFGYEPRIP